MEALTRRVFMLITDAATDDGAATAAAGVAADMLSRTGGIFNSDNGTEVDCHVINIGNEDTSFSAPMDNTPEDGVVVVTSADPSPLVYVHRARLAELAVQHRLPGIYGTSLYADAAPLVYGANVTDIWRRAPAFVDKIIRGARPADIPVEAPAKFDFTINRTLAQALGLSGFVRNLPDGRVEAAFEGDPGAVAGMIAWCREGPPLAAVDDVAVEEEPPRGDTRFRITH